VLEACPRLRSERVMELVNRSDRHSQKPATCRAFEAMKSIRHECADFHRGLGQQSVTPRSKAGYATATGCLTTRCHASVRCRAQVASFTVRGCARRGRGPYVTRHSFANEACLQQRSRRGRRKASQVLGKQANSRRVRQQANPAKSAIYQCKHADHESLTLQRFSL